MKTMKVKSFVVMKFLSNHGHNLAKASLRALHDIREMLYQTHGTVPHIALHSVNNTVYVGFGTEFESELAHQIVVAVAETFSGDKTVATREFDEPRQLVEGDLSQ